MWQEILDWFTSVTANADFKTDIDINMADGRGWTPLHHAVDQNHIEIVHALIDQGANVNAVDNDGDMPLHYVSLSSACHRKVQVEIANALIKQGADIHTVRGHARWTPLHRAIYYDCEELVSPLIDGGADINAVDKDGYTPLLYVVREGKPNAKIANVLIERGANVNVISKDGWTPLYYAVYKLQVEIVNKLIAQGANINAVDNHGMTPLHYAVRNYSVYYSNSVVVIGTLIKNGADPLLKNIKGSTAIDFAISNQKVLKIIKTEREKYLEQEKMKRMLLERFYNNNIGKISKLFPRNIGNIVISLILEKLSLQDLDNLIKVVLNDDVFQMLNEMITEKLPGVQNNNYYTILNELEDVVQDRVEEEYRKLNQWNQNSTGKLSEAMVKQVYQNRKAM